MNILLLTPAPPGSRNGNRTTAMRWARLLRGLGHRVTVAGAYRGERPDLLIALHAWRSAADAAGFRARCPRAPLVVALTGTDIYRFQESHPRETLGSMEMADALVCLHERVKHDIPRRFAPRLHVIYQSAPPLPWPRRPAVRHFDVCVVGHLREEKDSLRAAFAARGLPAASRIRIVHLGKAHDEAWAAAAREETATNPRYHWRGEVPGWAVRREFRKARLMVLSSIMEGGANVISEATVAGVPVIASDISGSVGLLGADYEGYYPVGDTDGLRTLLLRAEDDAPFLARLARQCEARARLFTPEQEAESWRALLADLDTRDPRPGVHDAS